MFEREDRYFVVKYKDLAQLDSIRMEQIIQQLYEIGNLLPPRDYVVVESDWPEYEIVWKMIEDRVTNAVRL